MRKKSIVIALVLAASVLALCALPALAAYPEKPIHVVNYVAPGCLMIIALMLVMGERRKFLMAATACVWMAATWAIFNKFLLLGLPVGRLFTR